MPGDWHILMNFQKALMKPYFDAGLKDLAKSAGYPIASIQVCGQFKRTHQFLFEVWEALFRAMIRAFIYNKIVRIKILYSLSRKSLHLKLTLLPCHKLFLMHRLLCNRTLQSLKLSSRCLPEKIKPGNSGYSVFFRI